MMVAGIFLTAFSGVVCRISPIAHIPRLVVVPGFQWYDLLSFFLIHV